MNTVLRTAAIALALAVATGTGYAMFRLLDSPAERYRPVFSLADPEGQMHSITEWDGKVMLINFWATWCAPCREEIPLLVELQAQYQERGLQVIGVALDDPAPVKQLADQLGINYPILVGGQDAMAAARGFGIDFVALPYTALTDRDGRIVKLHTGQVHREQIVPILEATL